MSTPTEQDTFCFRPLESFAGQLLKMEALRGGAREPFFFPLWANLYHQNTPLVGDPFHGQSPIRWLHQSAGVPTSDWSVQTLHTVFNPFHIDYSQVHHLLHDLVELRVQLDFSTPQAKQMAFPLLERIIRSSMNIKGYVDAQKLGVCFCVQDPASNLLETLFFLDHKNVDLHLKAILAAADAEQPNGAHILLSPIGKNGATPIHWAARALNPAALQLLADKHLDIHAVDNSGSSAGHWAARKYGIKKQKLVGPTLQKLTELGYHWQSTNHKQQTALAALSAKGPLEPLLEIIKLDPSLLHQGAPQQTAFNKLTQRGAQTVSTIEQTLIELEVPDEARPPTKAPQRPRL